VAAPQVGYFHTGATSAIADSAGGYAAFTLFPENTSVLTVEYKINLLALPSAVTSRLWERPLTWTNTDRVPTGSIRRQGQPAVASCGRPADADLRKSKIQTVSLQHPARSQ
jgi:acyl-coenzyme A thioesterase PaaI-like protein